MHDPPSPSSANSFQILTPSSSSLNGEGLIGFTNEITEDLTATDANANDDVTSPSSDDESSVHLIDVGDGRDGGERVLVKPRSYQMEMVEESLRRNIIVAMDTGSGKTHIAVLRILHELDRMSSDQLIWFLAPTVALCAQQFEYLQSQITSVHMKYLSGADEVERWTEQSLWDAVLENCKVVVSTYQILLDALTHGFVKMESLALIVFDEAHNCVGKQAGAKLMHNFYHRQKVDGGEVPHILGLTASPLMRSDPSSLNKIEETLDAICRTPTKHRSELRLQVKLPVFSQVYFEKPSLDIELARYTKSIDSIPVVLASLNIKEDPYVISLIEENSERSRRRLAKVQLDHKTWTSEQIKKIYKTSLRMYGELGPWAADHYIAEVVANSAKILEGNDDGFSGEWDVSQSEKQYLANALSRVTITRTKSDLPATILISDKVTKLIETLAKMDQNFRGIIFVQERATAEILARLLRTHPQTRDSFNVGTMVGISSNTQRTRNMADVVDLEAQNHVLSRFRSGEINLVVATSVLEEGIDVPACNVVLCFQKPANLKSFVQRRGRARQKESKLILFLELMKDELGNFQKLEEMMKRIYEDDMRTLAELVLLEDEEEEGHRAFRVASTGALLELDNAVSHLHHFCATLPAKAYVDLRPEFICTAEGKLVRARVILPLLVHESVRTATGLTAWKSEKNAIKDAAFEAYIALYKAGLVNDNLLPLMRHDEEANALLASTIDKRVSLLEGNEQTDVWIDVAKLLTIDTKFRQTTIKVDDLEMEIFLPVALPAVPPFTLYWDSRTEFLVSLSGKTSVGQVDVAQKALQDTFAIVGSAYSRRFEVLPKQQVMSFSPKANLHLRSHSGQDPLTETGYRSLDSTSVGLVRDELDPGIAYIYKGYLPTKPAIRTVQNPFLNYQDSPQDEPYVSLKRLSRRNDFLQKVTGIEPSSEKEHSAVLPLSRCIVDQMPFHYIRFALLLPSILHRLSVYLLAEKLSTTILKVVQISNIDLVVTAICASSAKEPTNYQRLEFLGDSILKLCTSIQLMAEYPLWHEGLLSFKKDRFVSNGRLAKASLDAGLDRFIITKQYTANKWRPLYVTDLASSPTPPSRQISSKILADVVEALIGAATLDGGIPKAITCLSVLLPELNWKSLTTRQSFLYQRTPTLPLPPILAPIEDLLGYTFTKKSLLIEALTHASYTSSTSGSLERLEYLGDAILDKIIVTEMYPHNLSHIEMHLLRTAMVNADFLAWTCFETSISIPTTIIDKTTHKPESKEENWPIWRFLRHACGSLSKDQQLTSRRHLELRDEINDAIENGTHYPWALLSRLDARKFFSDVIESLIGAIWIDSHHSQSASLKKDAINPKMMTAREKEEASFTAVRTLLERLGILKYMRRILKEKVHVWHPKEELGRLADDKKVRYVIEKEKGKGKKRKGNEEEGLVGGGLICTVWVGGELICRVGGGVSKIEVQTRGAQRAVEILKGRTEDGKGGGGNAGDIGVVGANAYEDGEGNGNGSTIRDGERMDIDAKVVAVESEDQDEDAGGVMIIDV